MAWKKTGALAASVLLLSPAMAAATSAPGTVASAADPAVFGAPVNGVNGIAVSDGHNAMVRVVRPDRKQAKSDPLTQFGAGFTIVVVNKSDNSEAVGPESVVVKNASGQVLEILTADRIAALKQQRAEHHRTFGLLAGVAMGMLGAAGAASNNVAAAANSTALIGIGVAVAQTSSNSADAELSQTDALVADYNTTPLVSATVAPLHGAAGSVRVNGLKDVDPATLVVTINGESHEIHFDKGNLNDRALASKPNQDAVN